MEVDVVKLMIVLDFRLFDLFGIFCFCLFIWKGCFEKFLLDVKFVLFLWNVFFLLMIFFDVILNECMWCNGFLLVFFFIESKFLVLVLGMLFCLGILISFCILWVWGLFLKEFVFDGGVDLLCSFMGFEFVIFIVKIKYKVIK